MEWVRRHPIASFLATLTSAWVTWLLLVTSYGLSETTSCHECAVTYQSNNLLQDVNLCELKKNPEHYENRVFRMRASLGHDSGYLSLFERACYENYTSTVPAGLGSDFAVCWGKQRALQMYTGLGTWYDGAAEVTLVGRYGEINDKNQFQTGRQGITILCLEKVAPYQPLVSVPVNMLRYSLAQVLRPFQEVGVSP
jgi:hypothetical protein